MATISFDREIIIKDKEAVKLIREHLEFPVKTIQYSSVNVSEELQRGKDALKSFSSRLKKLSRR